MIVLVSGKTRKPPIGKKWVAVQRLSDRIAFDGWILVRLKDVQAVSMDPDPECFEIKSHVRSSVPRFAPCIGHNTAARR